MMNFYMPVQVFAGKNAVKDHMPDLLKSFRGPVLLVTGASSAKKSGALDDVLAVLSEQNIKAVIYDGIRENPLLSSCMEAGRMAHDAGCDLIIGIGGGSPMDAAKSIAVYAAYPDLTEEEFYAKKWTAPLPVFEVGTTSGTGSEVTTVSVVTDSTGRKHSMSDPRLYPMASFGDPRYTMTLPLTVTLSTGADVIAHCMESFFNKKANEFSRAAAARGIRLLIEPLKKAENGEPLTLEDRSALYEASILGGLAICVTGTAFPHNVGYFLTERHGVPHGIACAVFLPRLMEHIRRNFPETADALYDAAGISEEDLKTLILGTLPALAFRLTEEEIEAELPRWENNRTVMSTLGGYTLDEIRVMLKEL